jgi:outer membrane protein TolC
MQSRKKTAFLIILFVLMCPGYAQKEPVGALSIDNCILLALKNNPQVKGVEGTVQSGKGNFLSNKAGLLPQLSLQAQATEGNGSANSSASPFYSANLQVQQLLYDFGKTSARVAGAQSLYNAAQYDSASTIQNLVLLTAVAYINVLECRSLVQINGDALKQTEDHLNKARILYDAGRGLKYDVVKADVDKANADLSLSRSRNAERISFLQLQNLIGETIDRSVIFTDTIFVQSELLPVDSAIALALENRTELHSLNMKLQSADARLLSAKRARMPSLAATGNCGYKISDLPVEKQPPSWNIGAVLAIPLFTSGALQGAVDQAEGERKNAEAVLNTARQTIILDVQQQISSCTEAIERVDISVKTIDKAKLALTLAQERYNVGSGNAIEVADAEIALENAKIAEIQARCDYRIARLKLSRAIGTDLFKNTQMEKR